MAWFWNRVYFTAKEGNVLGVFCIQMSDVKVKNLGEHIIGSVTATQLWFGMNVRYIWAMNWCICVSVQLFTYLWVKIEWNGAL